MGLLAPPAGLICGRIRGWHPTADSFVPRTSLDAQAAVILEAQGTAGVPAESVTYVETHGTGTPIGDPIEIAALTKVFRASTDKKSFCAIGSAKTNIGHVDTAAGVTGLIKTILALKHRQIPPSLHFEEPNPRIDFANGPFYVNTTLYRVENERHAPTSWRQFFWHRGNECSRRS